MTSTTGSSCNSGKPSIQLPQSPLILGFQEVKYRMMSARRKSEVEFSLTTVPPISCNWRFVQIFPVSKHPLFRLKS
ncbi:hypothetical protein HanXRQr2_Chr10g0465881 [Helianthus annuus]|uniref:Uncharacterized protein n=1 Tax=Helianthus annuus TaxID=4232 RepID=A0A251TQF8_HELAN|nr:hypothetical protein HanXRQr2_Chr10g0465881 [Helianthus annuus]